MELYRATPTTCHFQLMFNKQNSFISNTTEGHTLKCERASGFYVHYYLVTFWWWLWSTGRECSHPNPLPEQRVVCGTDRGHLALLCQLLQLVGFVLCLYESLLHIFQSLDTQGVGMVGGFGWREKRQHYLSLEVTAKKWLPDEKQI